MKKSIRRVILRFSIITLILLVNSLLNFGAERPNILIIMSDDMGYSHIGCYGSEIDTPVLDKLAKNGLRFTQFYNTARCCPTRASLLTGLYPHQTGIGHMMGDYSQEGYKGDLNRNCVTIAEALKPAGYSTYCIGKWHVTPAPEIGIEPQKHNWPLQRGFDRYYGIINGGSSFWDPNSLVRDNTQITIKNDPHYQPAEPYHLTDAISDNAVMFIEQHDSSEPFFMYVAYTSAHWPMHARERDINKYKGIYDEGYEPVRKSRIKKMKELGVIKSNAELSPTAGNWNEVEDKIWEAACMEVYAAMVDQMDQGIGRIVSALRKNDQLDNTLILFLQDNGGCAESGGRKEAGPMVQRAISPTLPPIPDDSIHYAVSVPTQTRDGYPVLRGHVMPGPADTYIGYGKSWANVSNTPHREYKHWVHEGGISTPLIVHWPEGIKARNQLRDEPSHLIDLMATCIDVSGARYPGEVQGKKITPMEGKSLVPVFNKQSVDREAIYWEHEGNRAIRQGDWKLVSKWSNEGDWELYNIAEDRSELNNLAEVYPDRIREMADMWQTYAERTHVLPWPDYLKKTY